MNTEWMDYLTAAGANIENGVVSHFGTPGEESSLAATANVITDLSHLGHIIANGEDSSAFLQGQLSNDVREVNDEHCQFTSYCSPKGRMLANFYLFKRGGDFFLQLPREILEPTLKRLRMFVLRSQVSLNDVSDEVIAIGLSGPNAESLLKEAIGEAPQAAYDTFQGSDVTAIRLPGQQPRYTVVGEVKDIKTLWEKLSTQAKPVGNAAWRLLDIQAGIPTVFQQTVEAFVPQMTNMQAIGGVSFSKGCYTGQEVVARMQYLGKLKRRMYRAHVESATPPQPGDELYSGTSESGQGAGRVVDAQPSPQGGYELLAVVEIASAEAGDVRFHDSQGPAITFIDLPYPLEQAS